MENKRRTEIAAEPLGPETKKDGGGVEREYLITEVYYSLGGMNPFTYKEDPRGYFVSIGVEKRGTSSLGYQYRSFDLFNGGMKQPIESAPRFSAKRLGELAHAYSLEPDASKLAGIRAAVLAKRDEKAAKQAARKAS